MKSSERLWDLYRSILQNRLPIQPVDRAVAERYAQLAAGIRAKGEPRPQFDLVIAATALAHGLTVATCDAGHFAGIEGLEVEDWSV
jgi:tRNA(fMet)-specific endonuclease VapC